MDALDRHLDGDPPSKEWRFHKAFYDTRGSRVGAMVHLHSTHSVAVSTLPETDEDNALPPLTPYPIMRFGRVKLLPYFRPGDPEMAAAVRLLEGQRSAVLHAKHGPVVCAGNLDAANYAMKELEETAKLALMTRGLGPRHLNRNQIEALDQVFGER